MTGDQTTESVTLTVHCATRTAAALTEIELAGAGLRLETIPGVASTDLTRGSGLGAWGQAVVRAVADELDRREQERAQQIDQIIAADTATENAAYDAANTPAWQAADGLDNAASRQPIGWTVLMNHWTDQVPPTLFRAKLGTRDWAHAEAARLNENPDAGESFRPVAVYLDAIVSAPAASEEPIPSPNPDGVLGWIADRIDGHRWPLAEHGYPAHLHGIDDGTVVLDLLPSDADLEHAWEDLPDPVASYRITLTPQPAAGDTATSEETTGVEVEIPPVLNFVIAAQQRIKDAPTGATLVVRSESARDVAAQEVAHAGRDDLRIVVRPAKRAPATSEEQASA